MGHRCIRHGFNADLCGQEPEPAVPGDDATKDYPLNDVTAPNRNATKNKIDAIVEAGCTSIGDGLYLGQEELYNNGVADHIKIMVILDETMLDKKKHL